MEEEHSYELPNFKEAVASCDVNPQYEIPSNSTSGASAAPRQDKSKLKKPVCSWLCMCALVGFILVGSAAFASLALTAWNISQINHQSAKTGTEHMIMKLQNSLSGLETSVNVNISELKGRVMQLQNTISGLETSVNGSISEYERRINQLQIPANNLNELQASISRRTDILLRLNPAASCSHVLWLNPSSPSGYYWISSSNGSVRVYCTQMGKLPNDSAASCSALFAMYPSSPSDHYWIRSSNGSAVRVYCDMTRSCGGVTGGWMRVASLDMRDNSSQCPSGLRQGDSCNPERTCEIDTNSPSGKCVPLPWFISS